MKVAPVEKKAKPHASKLLKSKVVKGGALAKRKREILLRGFNESSLCAKVPAPVLKTSNGLAEDALSRGSLTKNSPKMVSIKIEKSSSLKEKSLQSSSPPTKKALSNDNKSTLVKQSDKGSAEAFSPKIKAVSVASPVLNIDHSTLMEQAQKSSVKRKSLHLSSPAASGKSSQGISAVLKPTKKSKLGDVIPVSRYTKSQASDLTPKSIKPSRKSSLDSKSLALSTPGDISFGRSTRLSVSKKSLVVLPTPLVGSESKKSSPTAIPTTCKKSYRKEKTVSVSTPEDSSTQSNSDHKTTETGKKSELKKETLTVSTSEKSAAESEIQLPAEVDEKAVVTSKEKVSKKNGSSMEEAAVSNPHQSASNIKKQALEPAAEKIINEEEASLPELKLQTSEDALKRKLPSTLSSPVESEVSSNNEPTAAKKTKSTLKEGLKAQVTAASIAVMKSVKSSKKIEPKRNESKMKAEKKSVERQDVSKDSRLQNLGKAAQAVLTLAEKRVRFPKKQLFAGDVEPVYLQIHSFRVGRMPTKIVRFNLPHSVYEDTADICLILADPIKGRKRDTEQDVIVENYKEMLENKGVKNIKEVIPFNYLRAQYGQYEMKRRFVNSYDVFLCDSRFIGHATHFLGRHFFNDKCITPIRVVKDGKKEFVDDFKSAIDFALHKTWMKIHANGTSFSVTVGNTDMTSDQIAANVLAVFNDLQDCYPGGLDNIKLAVLKCHESNPVPVFVSLRPHNEVRVPEPFKKSVEDKVGEPTIGELSTLPGREVAVYPSGRVEIRNKMTPEDEEYEKIMGHQPMWLRRLEQRRQYKRRLENDENDEESGEELPESKQISRKRESKGERKRVHFRGKKRFNYKKFAPKKTFSPRKKFSKGIKTNVGKKFVHKNTSNRKQKKGTSQKS